jgi:hypothetical protein
MRNHRQPSCCGTALRYVSIDDARGLPLMAGEDA